jgi:hypothetical protein
MKRLFFLALFAVAAWYGWNHRELFTVGHSDSEAVLVNSGSRAMLRVRITAGGQTYVRDVIEPEAHEVFPIPLTRQSDFRLRWDWRGLEGSPEWRGGEISPGPPRSRCTLQVFDDNGVTCSCVPIPTAADAH